MGVEGVCVCVCVCWGGGGGGEREREQGKMGMGGGGTLTLRGGVWGYLCRVVATLASGFAHLQRPGFLVPVNPRLPVCLPL
jgi:hypothetical protein